MTLAYKWRRADYSHRVGVPPFEWVELAQPEPVTSAVTHLAEVGPRCQMALENLTSEENQVPMVSGLPKCSSYTRDWLDVDRVLDAARALSAQLQPRAAAGEPLAAAEFEHMRKITLQRGGPPGWFLLGDSFVNLTAGGLDAEVDALVEEILMEAAARAAARARPSYPRGTTHGNPTYGSSDTDLLLHLLIAAAGGLLGRPGSTGSMAASRAVAREVAAILGEEATPDSTQLFSRTGGLAKAVGAYVQGATSAFKVAEVTSGCCRRRTVRGQSAWKNLQQLLVALIVKALFEMLPELRHYGADDVFHKLLGWDPHGEWDWQSDDISNYDLSVPFDQQSALFATLERVTGAAGFREYKEAIVQSPILGPSHVIGGAATLVHVKGTTASGDIMTAIDGTLLNLKRVIRCAAAAMRVSPREAWRRKGVDWAFIIQGDDTARGVRPGVAWDNAAWEAASLARGYKTKVVPGLVFLMYYYDLRKKRYFPLLSRVIGQTAFNEKKMRTTALEVAGLAARSTPRFWAHNPLADIAWETLSWGDCLLDWGIRRPADLEIVTATPFFRDTVARDVRRFGRATPSVSTWGASAIGEFVRALLDPIMRSDIPDVPTDRDTARGLALELAGHLAVDAEERGDLPEPLKSMLLTIKNQGASNDQSRFVAQAGV